MNLIRNIEEALSKSKGKEQQGMNTDTSIYDFKIQSLEGDLIDLGEFRGKFLLLVNVASKCGFTNQYKALQQLSDDYGQQLVVIGFPCNQFGKQEPGNAREIRSFCEMRYGVSFPLSEKIKVKGSEQHPIYRWLTNKEQNGKMNTAVRWNFQKYLVDPQGNLIDVFYSTTSPTSKKITRTVERYKFD